MRTWGLSAIATFLIAVGVSTPSKAACEVGVELFLEAAPTLLAVADARDCVGVEFHLLIRNDISFWPDRTLVETREVATQEFHTINVDGNVCDRDPTRSIRFYAEVRWLAPGVGMLGQPGLAKRQSGRIDVGYLCPSFPF